jgi:hypothetical protein
MPHRRSTEFDDSSARGPVGTQIIRLFGVVEYQQPALPRPQRVPKDLDGLGLLGVLGEAQPTGEGHKLAGDGGSLLGRHPPDQIVVTLMAVGIFDSELGLTDPTQPMQRLRLNLDDRGHLVWVQRGAQLLQQLLAAGEDRVAGRQVGHQGTLASGRQPIQHRGRRCGGKVEVNVAGLADGDQRADLGVPIDLGDQLADPRGPLGVSD